MGSTEAPLVEPVRKARAVMAVSPREEHAETNGQSLSPKGSRSADLIPLPRTWLILEQGPRPRRPPAHTQALAGLGGRSVGAVLFPERRGLLGCRLVLSPASAGRVGRALGRATVSDAQVSRVTALAFSRHETCLAPLAPTLRGVVVPGGRAGRRAPQGRAVRAGLPGHVFKIQIITVNRIHLL